MSLSEFFVQQTPAIADSVADLADADSERERHKQYLLLLAILSDFNAGASRELTAAVHAAIQSAHDESLKRLPKRYRAAAHVTPEQYQRYGQSAIRSALIDLGAVLQWIRGLGSQLRTGRDGLLRRLLGARGNAPLTDAASRDKLRSKIINVRGSDGIDRSYAPDNYGELLEDGATGSAEWDTAKTMSENLGSDLVVMSKATHKDFCDIFASRIYSRSGTDPRVYPLSIVPGNGSGKMHPRCVHKIFPVPPDFFTDAQLRAHSQLPAAFVELGSSGKASVADFQKLFLSKSPAEWGLK